jgi:hypothetical protein
MAEQDKIKQLRKKIENDFKRYKGWSMWWSFVYHGSLILTAVFGAAAALILKLEMTKAWTYQTDISAILAGAATVMAAIAAAGAFDKKWRINRDAQLGIELMKIDLMDKDNPEVNPEEIKKNLKNITRKQSEEISGAEE